MNKSEVNNKYAEMIKNKTFSKDMLLSAWSVLDKDVSKYAYLKKKFANAGESINDGNICEFNQAIQRRNIVERGLKSAFGLNHDEIKVLTSELPKEKIIYKKYIDDVCRLLEEIYV